MSKRYRVEGKPVSGHKQKENGKEEGEEEEKQELLKTKEDVE